MTTLTDTQVITASGGLVELGYSQVAANINSFGTTSAAATTVVSPMTVVCDGSPVLVEFFSCEARPSNTLNDWMIISLYQDGTEAYRQWMYFHNTGSSFDSKPIHLTARLTPSAGSHTFGVKAYTSSGSGTINSNLTGVTGSAPAFLRVSKIVQATQWPAVTTGTIICTSSTRPASPFQGQEIYETDTKKKYMWNGSSWLWTWGEQVGRRLAYQQQTSPYTVSSATLAGAANIFASNLSWTADGTSAYRIKFFTPIEISTIAATEHINYSMVDASGNSLGLVGQGGEGGGDHRNRNPANIEFFYTPSAGTATVNMRAYYAGATGAQVYGGGGGSGNWIPMWMAVYGPDLT